MTMRVHVTVIVCVSMDHEGYHVTLMIVRVAMVTMRVVM